MVAAPKKSELRKLAKETSSLIVHDEQKIQERTKHLIQQILLSDEYQKAKNILLYYPLEDEFDLIPLVYAGKSKNWFLPRAIGDGLMLLLQFKSADELLHGRYGIMVPPATNKLIDKSELDLIIVPGMMFDRKGYRLGRGGGYYDRLLADSSATSIGVCFNELLIDYLPREKHDCPVDKVLQA